MATAFWRGVSGTAGSPKGGIFGTAANWRDGVLPGADTDVFFSPGAYTVEALSRATVESVSVGAGVTLRIGGAQSIVLFTLDDASTNFGTIALGAGQISLASNASLTNYGLITNFLANDGSSAILNGMIFNFGQLATSADGSSINVISRFRNEDGGEVAAQAGDITFGTNTQNDGLVGAYAGNVVRFAGFDNSVRVLSNLSGNVLSGGQWVASGDGSKLLVGSGGSIAQLSGGADVTLAGAGSEFSVAQGDQSVIAIDTSLRFIGLGSALRLGDGRSFGAGNLLEVAGTLSLSGGTLSAELKIGRDGSIAGAGTVTGPVHLDGDAIVGANDGARAGRLVFAGNAEVAGTISGKGTIVFAGAASEIEKDGVVLSAGLEVSHGALSIDRTTNYGGTLTLDHAQLDLIAPALKLGRAATIIESHVVGRADHVLTFARGAHFSGTSETDVAVSAKGRVSIDGSATFDAAVSGRGSFQIGADATLEFGSSVAKTTHVVMAGAGATLRIDEPGEFSGHLSQFGTGDTVALAGVDASSRLVWRGDADGAGGTLVIFDSDGRLTLHFDDGVYARSRFDLSAGTSGEALLTYAPSSDRTPADHLAASAFWTPGDLGHLLHTGLV